MGVRRSAATGGSHRSLVELWLGNAPHPVVTLAVVAGLEAAAMGALVWWAGWSSIWHALSIGNVVWFAVCAAGQLIAYGGYALTLKAAASVDRGVRLSYPAALAVVSAGFGSMFSASMAGGFSVDYLTLKEAGLSDRRAFQRVLGLSALEYAVLAPPVAVCGLVLYLGLDGRAEAALTLPWLAVVPGVFAAWWLTSPGRVKRFGYSASDGALRRGVCHLVAALLILRLILVEWRRYGWAFVGAGVYWCGDIATFWASLRVFDVRVPIAAVVVAYATGWALTRRSLPSGGPGVVEIVLAYVLTWFHVPFGLAAAGVVAYRLFNFWLSLLPAAAVLPFGRRLEQQIVAATPEPP